MIHTQSRRPTRPYVAHVPPPGSLQEWLIRALEVRKVQTRSEGPAPAPAEPAEPDVPAAEVVAPEVPAAEVVEPATPPTEVAREPTDDPALPPAREVAAQPLPAEPEEVAAPPGVQQRAVGVGASVYTIRTRAKIMAMVAMVVAALAAGVGWQFSDASGAPGSGQAGVLGARVAGLDGTAPVMTRPVKPAAFDQTVTSTGWQVRIAGLKNTPQLTGAPGLTTAASPRGLRMSVTLVNVSDHPLAADSWALSATVNGKPAQMILYPPDGYVGLPSQLIPPGASMVFPIVVAMPLNRADLTIEAINRHDGLATAFTGNG